MELWLCYIKGFLNFKDTYLRLSDTVSGLCQNIMRGKAAESIDKTKDWL